MESSATNCSIRRITIGVLPVEYEALVDKLRDLAEESGETDPDEESRQLLYRWLEDVDDLLYFDGPIYDDSIVIYLGDLSFSIYKLISSGAKLKVVDRTVVRAPSGCILAYTDMGGGGSLEWLSICGDEEAFSSLCESGSLEDPSKIASDLEILVKQWDTPIGELTMFVGIAFQSNGSYEWKEHWGDGSYENYVNSEEADLLEDKSSSFQPMAEGSIDELVKEVCSKFE